MAAVDPGAPQIEISGRLRATIPADWAWKESLTLYDRVREMNVIFSSEPVEAGLDPEVYAAEQGQLLRAEFRDYNEISMEEMQMLGGRRGFLRRFEWQPDDRPRMTQLQLYLTEDGRGYTATATSPTSSFPEHSAVLVQILEHLRLGGEGSEQEEAPASAEPVGPAVLITDNPQEQRYELRVGDEYAGRVDYRLRSQLIALLHTEVAEPFQGKGLASRLAAYALEDARRRHLAVLPFCPLINDYIREHPEFRELVPEDRRGEFDLAAEPNPS